MKGTGLREYYLCDINKYSYSEVKPCTDISFFFANFMLIQYSFFATFNSFFLGNWFHLLCKGMNLGKIAY